MIIYRGNTDPNDTPINILNERLKGTLFTAQFSKALPLALS